MKPWIILLCLLAMPALADGQASSSKCAAAVDAADSMNVNKPDCVYSNEGLNGFLQKAFK